MQSVGERLDSLGATVSDSARPAVDFEDAFETCSSLLWGVMAAGLPEETKAELRANRAPSYSISSDTMADNMAYFSVTEHGEWRAYNNKRFFLRKARVEFYKDWDILICPQTATEAFPHDHGAYMERTLTVDNEAQDYIQQVFWAGIITVAHLPSMVFPSGLSKGGVPVGLLAVGGEYQDYITIDFARLMAEELGGFVPPPNYP